MFLSIVNGAFFVCAQLYCKRCSLIIKTFNNKPGMDNIGGSPGPWAGLMRKDSKLLAVVI